MGGGALNALWDEPRAAAPPGSAWWDRALVAGLIPVTALEAGFREEMVWPAWHAGWALVCVATLLWRPHHPLAMLILAYGAQTVAGVVPALAGEPNSVLNVTAVVLLLAYSLGRWASGRGVVIGSCYLLVLHLAREPLYDASGSSMVVGVGALMLPVAIGALMRLWARSQVRTRDEIRAREREQEAVTNAGRHAQDPTVVSVDLSRDGTTVQLRVHDDGRPAAPSRVRRASPSYGLVGMRERLSLLGGEVRAGPDPEGGWTVEATVPVAMIDTESRP